MHRLVKTGATCFVAATSVSYFIHHRDSAHTLKFRFMRTAANAPATTVTVDPSQSRLVVIGKTGNGKSTVCNTLLGKNAFEIGRGMDSATKTAQMSSATWKRDQFTVVDTPDPVNWDGPGKPDVFEEVQRWKTMVTPNPSAILLAVRCDVRYTAEEYDVYRQIKQAWGAGPFTRRLVVAFTFGDRQDRDLREELKGVCPELKAVMRDAKDRFVVFDGKADKRDDQLAKIQEFVGQMDREAVVPDWYPTMQKALAGVGGAFGLLFAAFYTSVLKGPTAFAGVFGVLATLGLVGSQVFKERIVQAIDSNRKRG